MSNDFDIAPPVFSQILDNQQGVQAQPLSRFLVSPNPCLLHAKVDWTLCHNVVVAGIALTTVDQLYLTFGVGVG